MVLDKKFDNFLFGVERFKVIQSHALDGHLHDFVLADTKTALLFGQIVFAGVDQHTLGNETHNFTTRDAQAAVGSTTAYLVETEMHGSHLDAGDVHRHLCDAVILDVPADGLGALEGAGNHDGVAFFVLHDFAAGFAALALGATLFAHVEGYGVGTAGAGGVEVVVDSHEEIACAYLSGAGLCHMVVPLIGSEVGLPFLAAQTAGKALVFAGAAVGQIAAFGLEGGILVAVDGDVQLLAQAFAQFVGIFHHLFHSDVADGDEGAHIGGTLAGMGAVVVAHVDEFSGFLHHAESGLACLFGLAHKGDDGAVGGLAGIYIKEFYSLDLLNLGGDLVNDIHVASFADIGDALDKLFHILLFLCYYSLFHSTLQRAPVQSAICKYTHFF